MKIDLKKLGEEFDNLAPSKRSSVKSIYTAFQLLKDNGGEMQRKELLQKMSEIIPFEDWELEVYKSNGQIKWVTIFLFYSIDTIKTGWLVKNKGLWQLTDEGMQAAKNLKPIELLDKAGKGYREWRALNEKDEGVEKDVDIQDEQVQQATLEALQTQANEGIGLYLESIHFSKFQKICSALLRIMGLFTDFEATSGPDGGIDIIAYQDPLGIKKPRIKVQVKNYKASVKVDVKEVRELKGLLNASEHSGIFITSGYFTSKAKEFARNSDVHIKLIDRDNFIELWQQNYIKLSESEKNLLPLNPIYFLGNIE